MLEVMAAWAILFDAAGFFDRREVEFWGPRRREEPAPVELWADSNAPPPARRLLDAPTRENAEAYIAWQAERLDRLQKALAVLEDVRNPGVAPILYFSRPGCRSCELQEPELRGLPVTRVPEGSPLWERYKVEATPTLVVEGKVFRGFTPRGTILKGLGRE